MKKRVYNSESREAQAADTKRRILKAAKELFQSEGFDRVTISSIAEKAEVSKPTIYALFKSKRGVLQYLIDEALPPNRFTALVDQVMQESSPEKRLQITAGIARQIYDAERDLMDILRGATVLSREFKQLEQEREERRYQRQEESIQRMMKEKVLSKELTLEKARDIFWALTGRDLYHMLVLERGWTSDEYEKHLANLLIKTLLKTIP